MQIVITAVGPDNVGLADPIIHHVTGLGANIAEIQMFDHDEEQLFSMLTRIELERGKYEDLRTAMAGVAKQTKLSIRTWTPEIVDRRPRLAVCVTYRPEPALALLRAIRDGQVKADVRLMIGNRDACRSLAEQFGLPHVFFAYPDRFAVFGIAFALVRSTMKQPPSRCGFHWLFHPVSEEQP